MSNPGPNRIRLIKLTALTLFILCFCFPKALHSQEKDFNTVIQRLKDKDTYTRRDAARELGLLRNPSAVEPLLVALRDKDAGVRWRAAKILGKIKDPGAAEPLIIALKDADPNVREEAEDALRNMGAPAVNPLLDALAEEALSREKAEEILEDMGQPAVESLVDELMHKD